MNFGLAFRDDDASHYPPRIPANWTPDANPRIGDRGWDYEFSRTVRELAEKCERQGIDLRRLYWSRQAYVHLIKSDPYENGGR